MDLFERIRNPDGSLAIAVSGLFKNIWTALPVIVKESDGHVATLQSAIKGEFTDLATGEKSSGPIAPFKDVPIHHPGGGGLTSTYPHKAGDEGMVHFTARAQDSWWQNGGENNDPIDERSHSLADGRYIPGGRSQPRKLAPAPSSESMQHRSDDGNHVVDVHPQNGIANASTKKHLTVVGGQDGSGTLHLPDKVIKNAKKILLNTVETDGVPKPGKITIAQKRLVATTPLPNMGQMAQQITGLLSAVLSSGPGALFADPTALANAALGQMAQNGATAVTGGLGGAGATLVAALTGSGGLTGSLAALSGLTAGMSGAAAPTGGNPGLADVRDHLRKAETYFGDAPPASVDPKVVTAPIDASNLLESYAAQIELIVAQALGGTMSVEDATAAIEAITAAIDALGPAASAAIAALKAAETHLANAMEAASPDAATASLHATLAGASPALKQLQVAVEAIFALDDGEVQAAAAFPVDGARGGM
jgi:hypothetical protein